jgi:hypothetical protein
MSLFRRTPAAAPTAAAARLDGQWVPQGRTLAVPDGVTDQPDDSGVQKWLAWRPVMAAPVATSGQLEPVAGVPRQMYGGAAMSRDPMYDRGLGASVLDGKHNAISNRPNVLIRDATVLPWRPSPPTLQVDRPVTDAANQPDYCA